MPWTDSVETESEGTHGGAAADEPTPAEPDAAGEEALCNGQWPANTGGEERASGGQRPTRTEGGGEEEDKCFVDEDIGSIEAEDSTTAKRVMSGIDVLDSVSKSMSEMSLSSKREAAAAQGLPMWNLCVPPAREPTITMKASPLMPKAVMSKTQSSNTWFSWRRVK